MRAFHFKHVCIESFAINLPSLQVSSAELEDRIAPLYNQLKIPFGTLEKLSGVGSRYLWDPMESPAAVGAAAAEEALSSIPFAREEIGAVLNCSVTRDYFEPATACIVHERLGLGHDAMALDITNACIGVSNGIMLMGNLIETGVIKAGLLVTGENVSRIVESSVSHMLEAGESLDREQLLRLLPTFTLGCGAAAIVLCHESIASKGHRVLGAVSRSATEHSSLCKGDGDYYIYQKEELNPLMHTESQELISSAARVGSKVWSDMSEFLSWSRDDVDRIICHQVGKQLGRAFYEEIGLDVEKEFPVYPRYGNQVSAALPSALITAAQEGAMNDGDKTMLLGFGSGLNVIFTALEW